MRNRIAICASGEGTNFEAIFEATRNGSLSAEVVGLIASRGSIPALERAKRLQIPFVVISPKTFPTREKWDETMSEKLREWNTQWVVLAGFLLQIGPRVLRAFPHRVINSHPALLPKFGGVGMYGEKVHAAVLQSGEKESGFTIHTVDDHYDQGKILLQKRVPVLDGDTPETLAKRVKTAELESFPKILQELVSGHKSTS